MKKLFLALLCLFIMSASVYADMSKEELQQMYLAYLKSRNISAKVDGDGDIEFTYTGENFSKMTYWIMVDEDDLEFFRILKDGGYTLDTPQEKQKAYLAASAATRNALVAKVFLNPNGDNISASAEVYLVSPGDFKTVFPKLMRELDDALYRFLKAMQ